MKERKERSIKVLGTGSVFQRIFLSLLLFFAALILIVVFWVNHVSSREQQHQIMQSKLDRISGAERLVEQSILDLTGSMSQLTWSTEILSYTLNPLKTDQSRLYQIQKKLENAVKTLWIVKRAVYYCKYSGKVFDSNSSSVLELNDFAENWLLTDDPESDEPYHLIAENTDRKVRTYMITFNGRLVLRMDLIMGKHLSSILYEINTALLNSVISNSNGTPEENIYPYDSEGEAVLGNILTYSRITEKVRDIPEEMFITQENVSTVRLKKGNMYYRREGERIPWIYLMPVVQENMQVSIASTLKTWMPLLLLMLAASIIISYYVVIKIYQPIRHLLRIALPGPADMPSAGGGKKAGSAHADEFTILEDAYSQAVGQQAQMSQLISRVAPDVLEHMLSNLLAGRSYTTERIEGLLEGIGNPIPAAGRFLLCTCLIEEPEDRTVTEEEHRLYIMSLQNLIQEFSGKGYSLYSLRMDRSMIVVLLSFPSGWSAVQIKKAFVDMQKTLAGNAEVLPYRLWFECGQIYSHLIDSRTAYRECLEKINYHRETENPEGTVDLPHGFAAGTTGEDDAKLTDIHNRFWYKEKVQLIFSLIARGERSGASLALEQLIDEMDRSCEEILMLCSACETLAEEFTEKAVSYPLTEAEQSTAENAQWSEKIEKEADRETVKILTLERCQDLIQLIFTYSRKNRYRYVDLAKEYISEHYADSSLSLNDVADHIGISGSYLSELFNELGGDKFSGYLASYRVEKARQLLQGSQLPVKDVGMQCGFNSVQNFNRVFKKYSGVTPSQYRDSKKSSA